MKKVRLKTCFTSQYLKDSVNYNVWNETENTYGLMDNDGSIIWFHKDLFDVVNEKQDLYIKRVRCNECAGIVLSTYKTVYNTYICDDCAKKFNIISD